VYETIRLTISLPKDKASIVREKAKTHKMTISRYLGECIEHSVAEEERLLMVEGYKARAKDHLAFARLTEDAAREVITGSAKTKRPAK
jgi:hypothetical protein